MILYLRNIFLDVFVSCYLIPTECAVSRWPYECVVVTNLKIKASVNSEMLFSADDRQHLRLHSCFSDTNGNEQTEELFFKYILMLKPSGGRSIQTFYLSIISVERHKLVLHSLFYNSVKSNQNILEV